HALDERCDLRVFAQRESGGARAAARGENAVIEDERLDPGGEGALFEVIRRLVHELARGLQRTLEQRDLVDFLEPDVAVAARGDPVTPRSEAVSPTSAPCQKS